MEGSGEAAAPAFVGVDLLIFWWISGHGHAVLFSCWCSGGQRVTAESDLLPLERGINYVGSSTLLGQPKTIQN